MLLSKFLGNIYQALGLLGFTSVNLGVEYLCNKGPSFFQLFTIFYVVFAVVNIMMYDM